MNITVNYSVGGTAIDSGPDPDYTPILLGSVVIPAGQTSATVSITPTQNGTVEGSETAILTATSGTNYTVGSPASATVTITNGNTAGQAVWLPMDDGSGTTATDYSGNGNNATLEGDTTWTTDTPTGSGYALSFDGTSGCYAGIPASPPMNIGNNMTISMWVKGTAPSGYPRLLGNDYSQSGVDTGEGIEIQANDDATSVGLSIFTSGGGTYQDGGIINNVINGSWNQIAYTFSNGIVEEYLNGVNVGTTTYNVGNNDGFGSPNPWILAPWLPRTETGLGRWTTSASTTMR